MTIRPRAARLLVVTAALSLALAACGGTGDTGGLPGADDLGGDAAGDQPDEQADQPVDEQSTPPETSAMCTAEQPDCQDTIEPGDDAAAGSCPTGDEDCTDESYGGTDVARPIPMTGTPSDAERIQRGATSGAAGRHVTAAYSAGATTLELTFEGGACDLLEDVVVEESAAEVRVLVLSGMDASVDVCTQQIVQWSTEVSLDAPLGDRQLLDLAG